LLRPPKDPIIPFVSLPYITKEGAGGPPQPGFFGGWLGKSYDPLFVLQDPNADNFSIPELVRAQDVSIERLAQRRQLQSVLEGSFLEAHPSAVSGMDGFQRRAFELLSSE